MTNLDDILTISDSIRSLKKSKNAIILAHYYQVPDIQEVADMVRILRWFHQRDD